MAAFLPLVPAASAAAYHCVPGNISYMMSIVHGILENLLSEDVWLKKKISSPKLTWSGWAQQTGKQYSPSAGVQEDTQAYEWAINSRTCYKMFENKNLLGTR